LLVGTAGLRRTARRLGIPLALWVWPWPWPDPRLVAIGLGGGRVANENRGHVMCWCLGRMDFGGARSVPMIRVQLSAREKPVRELDSFRLVRHVVDLPGSGKP
jgi:hypothetical protein